MKVNLTPLWFSGSMLLFVACGGGGSGINAPSSTAPAFTTQPVAQSVTSGSPATFTVAASGNPSPTFTWQRSDDGGSTWTTLAGAETADYSFVVQYAIDNSALFQATATNSAGNAKSTPAALTITPQNIYSAGDYEINGVSQSGYWRNGTWLSIGNPYPYSGTYQTIGVLDNNVYAWVAGEALTGYWLNGAFVALSDPRGSTSNNTYFGLTQNDIYVVTTLPSTYGGGCGYFVNGQWTQLPNPPSATSAFADAACTDGIDLYVAGRCNGNSVNNSYGFWKNGIWNDLTLPSQAYVNYLTGITTYDGNVYIVASGTNLTGYWKNGNWNALPLISGEQTGAITSISISGGHVLVGGYCKGPSSGTLPAYWLDGVVISPALPSEYSGQVNSVLVSGPDVWAAGQIWPTAGNTAFAGYWLNGAWVGLPSPTGTVAESTQIIVQ